MGERAAPSGALLGGLSPLTPKSVEHVPPKYTLNPQVLDQRSHERERDLQHRLLLFGRDVLASQPSK